MEVLNWIKCGSEENGSRFCPLETVNLSNQNISGVYIIWHNNTGIVLYIGQGNIKERLSAHRLDDSILQFRGTGVLLTTWARVDDFEKRRQIERYLHNQLNPMLSGVSRGPMLEASMPT